MPMGFAETTQTVQLYWCSFSHISRMIYRVALKSMPLQNYHKILLKPAIEIRFLRLLRQIKVSMVHYTTDSNLLAINILCVTYFKASLTVPDPRSSDMRHMR